MTGDTPLKVLMLTSSYPRSRQDTAAVFLRYLAVNLRRRGAIVHVIAPADQLAGAQTEDGVTVHRFAYFPKNWRKLAYGSGILPNLGRNPFLWCQVPFFVASMFAHALRAVRNFGPDVVHAHWVIPQGLVAVLIKFVFRIPVVITAHGSDAHALKGNGIATIKRFCLRHSDVWTSNTRRTSEVLNLGGGLPRPWIIPMGVDVQLFETGDGSMLRSNLGAEELIILFVGRLVRVKGVDDLIQAFALLPEDLRSRSQLWIVGAGEEESSLHTLTHRLGISERVRFWGSVPNGDLPNYYASADLFVGPSIVTREGQEEGQGVVFLEAFAARLCVLTTRTGGIEDVIEDGRTGVLVDPGDPGLLAVTIEQLLSDERRRQVLADNAYREAITGYSWRTISDSFLAAYQFAAKCADLNAKTR